jgi:hypothetical protein
MSYANGNAFNDDDVEEETLVADYKEQVNNYGDEGADLGRADSIMSAGPADLRAQLEAAAAPLEFQASLETK